MVAFKGQSLPDSCEIDSALRLRNATSASGRQKDAFDNGSIPVLRLQPLRGDPHHLPRPPLITLLIIAEDHHPPSKKQSIQIQLSCRRWTTTRNLYAAPIRGANTFALDTTEPGNLFLAGGDLNAHSPLWEEHQPTGQRGELVEDWLLSQNASILNDGTATCINRGAGGLSTPDITAVSNAFSTGTE